MEIATCAASGDGGRRPCGHDHAAVDVLGQDLDEAHVARLCELDDRLLPWRTARTAGRRRPSPCRTIDTPAGDLLGVAAQLLRALLQGRPQALLEAPDLTERERATNLRGLAMLRAHLAELDRAGEAQRIAQEALAREHGEQMRQRKAEVMERVDALLRERGQ